MPSSSERFTGEPASYSSTQTCDTSAEVYILHDGMEKGGRRDDDDGSRGPPRQRSAGRRWQLGRAVFPGRLEGGRASSSPAPPPEKKMVEHESAASRSIGDKRGAGRGSATGGAAAVLTAARRPLGRGDGPSRPSGERWVPLGLRVGIARGVANAWLIVASRFVDQLQLRLPGSEI